MRVSQGEVESSIFKESYYEAFQMMWPLMSKESLALNWHIEYICEELQIMCERVIAGKPKLYDLIINVPPGTSKSSMTSVGLHPWLWSRMPHAQIISGSHTKQLSNELSVKSRDIIESEDYRRMFPNLALRRDSKLKTLYKNTDGGWRLATSVGSKIVGFHAHIIIIDDPLNPLPEKSDSKLAFEAANNWIHGTLPSRVVDKAVVPTVMVMQRLHQIDPTGYWLEWKKERRVKHICLPAELRDNVKPERLKKKYVNGANLLDPTRLSAEVIKDIRETLGQFASAAQLDQTPIAAGGNMFEVDKIKIVKSLPKIVKAVRFYDNAATDGSGDATAGPKLGEDEDGMFWIMDLVHGHWGSTKRENEKLKAAKSDGRDVEIGQEIEPGSSGKDSYLGTVKKLKGYRVRGFRAVGNKITRADTFSVQVNAGNVGMIFNPEWNHKVISELQYFPFGAHDDIVDGLSGCFLMLSRKRRKPKVG